MSVVLNIHYEHYVENNSDEERIHLLVHEKKSKDFYNYVKTFAQFHKPAISTTFIPSERPDLIKQLSKITFDKKDSYENYVNLNWLTFEAISVYMREGDIIGFSTILKRDKYFDKDEVRILNRYYEMPKMRRTSKVIADDHVCQMVLQQIDITKMLYILKSLLVERSLYDTLKSLYIT